MGSCFSEHLGDRLRKSLFHVDINPFGILYHPIVIAENLDRLIKRELITEEELIRNGELYHTWSHHGRFSGLDKMQVLEHMNHRVTRAHDVLQSEQLSLLITFGSALAHKRGEDVVANCHKYPPSDFKQELIPLAEMVEKWNETLELLSTLNPKANLIFTVSPVRYLKDGLMRNTRSKALLVELCHVLTERFPVHAQYFPAFEIVTDELRDYRFFENDMTHPNALAIEYVWERFMATCFDSRSVEMYGQWEPLRRAALHRSLHPGSTEDLTFKEKTLQSVNEFAVRYTKQQNEYLNELKQTLHGS